MADSEGRKEEDSLKRRERMSDKELKVFGVQQRPQKIYRTCNFEGLTSKKDEFLEKVVKTMEIEGFMKVSEVKPFRLSLGSKDVLRFWDLTGWRDKAAWHQMIGSDVLLEADKRGAKLRVGVRAEARNNDLRVGFFYFRKNKLKSVAGIKFFLAIAAFFAYAFVAEWFMFNVLLKLGWGLWMSALTTCVVVFLPVVPFIKYYGFTKPKRMLMEMEQHISEIAESLGGKQVTQFKQTTVKLED